MVCNTRYTQQRDKFTTKPCNILFKTCKQRQAQTISAYPSIVPLKSLTLKRKVNLISMVSGVKDIMVTGMTCTNNNKLLLSSCTHYTNILVLNDTGQYLRSTRRLFFFAMGYRNDSWQTCGGCYL